MGAAIGSLLGFFGITRANKLVQASVVVAAFLSLFAAARALIALLLSAVAVAVPAEIVSLTSMVLPSHFWVCIDVMFLGIVLKWCIDATKWVLNAGNQAQ